MGGEVTGPGKLSARGRMINMMYLVLIALLALNVSKEVLDAFVVINQGLAETTKQFSKKNQSTYAAFVKAAAENPTKAGPWKIKAYDIKQRAEALYQHIENLKIDLIIELDKLEDDDVEGAKKKMDTKEGLENKSNLDIPARMMLNEGRGPKLKEEIAKFRDFIVDFVNPQDEPFKNKILQSLNTDDPPVAVGQSQLSWSQEFFEHLPAVAVICNMTQMQSQVRNAEADIIGYLLLEIEAGALKFNKVDALVIPQSNYVTQGDSFRADVFLAASDSLTPLVIYIGDYDTIGPRRYEMVGTYDTLVVRGGRGKMRAAAKQVGSVKWGGIVNQKTLSGMKQYAFQGTYQVAKPQLIVSPTKMNVFYIGVDNPVDISVPGFPDDKIKPSVSGGGGSVRKARSGYIVKVTRVTRKGQFANVSVTAELPSGEKKRMGPVKFRVKAVPDPVASYVGREGSATIKKSELLAGGGIAAILKNFDFDLKFKVKSFDMFMTLAGAGVTKSAKSNRITPEMMKYLKKAKRGTRVYFENIKSRGPEGRTRNLAPISLKVL